MLNKYTMINTEKVRIQFCKGFETAFDRARKYHCLQKVYDTNTFLSLMDRNYGTSSYKNLLFTRKNIVIKIFLFSW